MSVHCCNRYCDIDDEFHRLQKDTGEYNGDWSDKDVFDFLDAEVEECGEQRQKLEKTRPNEGDVCPHCWGLLDSPDDNEK